MPEILSERLIGFDFETDRIAGERIIPPPVCLSVFADGQRDLQSTVDSDFDGIIEHVLLSGQYDIVAHNASFDLAVMAFHRPELMVPLFRLICDDRKAHCTIIREKLLHLTSHGNLEYLTLPDGSTQRIGYSLADLALHYFGLDLSEQKEAEDAWRTNYASLRGVPAAEYPAEAREYAEMDARLAHDIWIEQEMRREQMIRTRNIDPFATAAFRVAADFCLTLMTSWGMATDSEEFRRIQEMLKEALKPENTALLVEHGILRPAEEPRAYANGARNHDGTLKMTAGKEESIDTKALRAHMLRLKEQMPDDVTLRRTKPSERHPQGQLSFDAEWLDDHHHLCPVIDQYRDRQKLQKLVTTELPRMMRLDAEGNRTELLAPVVHPCFDVLKRTGRTSSFASALYPSFNCQNVDPRARGVYVPRPGYVLVSVDYSQMELGTLAQRCIDLFGKSVMADKINAGVDLHAFLGASIAYNSDNSFRSVCDDAGARNVDDIYAIFKPLEKHESEPVRKFYKHYRTLAKPTGLGYPGGLMPKTFVQYAKATYGVIVPLETAEMLREVWLAVFPEMESYFDFINSDCEDMLNSPRIVNYIDEDGEQKSRKQTVYAYSTPMGMYRAGADYCAAANGMGLQSPSAEGAIMSVINVTRACYDPTMGSILYDDRDGPTCRPVAFIHDELLLEIREDEHLHDRAEEVREIMKRSMEVITPNVEVRTSVAAMRRWDKAAEAVYNSTGRLSVWTPKEEK